MEEMYTYPSPLLLSWTEVKTQQQEWGHGVGAAEHSRIHCQETSTQWALSEAPTGRFLAESKYKTSSEEDSPSLA